MDTGQLNRLVSEALEQLRLPAEPAGLYDPVRYTLSLGGKRLRPLLVLMGCELAGGKANDALNPALGIELFHNFTLLHDDIMDKAPLRRNKPTVHMKWGSNTAILAGDALYTIACRLMAQAPREVLHPVSEIFHTTATQVCEGQQWDMDFETRENVGIDEYLNMIRLKTAVLLGASLQIGALCGGASGQQATLLYEAGCSLGMAFQLQDDLLDVFGDPAVFGKQPGGDILANKKTWLSLRALEKAGPEQRKVLQKWYQPGQLQEQEPNKKVRAVTALFSGLGIEKEAQQLTTQYFDKAASLLGELTFPPEKTDVLLRFASALMQRQW